jgi:hypothetical protein
MVPIPSIDDERPGIESRISPEIPKMNEEKNKRTNRIGRREQESGVGGE